MKVSINNPCHENWDQMTPHEQGAFCLAYQKTVVDFSHKTTQEIKDFFTNVPKSEKVCGRFRNDQLTQLSFDEFFVKFRSWILPKKIAVLLFFCFGLTLFSCKTTHEPLMGDVAIESNNPPDQVVAGAVVRLDDTTGKPGIKSTVNEVVEFKMGEVMAFPPDDRLIEEIKCIPKDSLVDKEYIKGKVKVEE